MISLLFLVHDITESYLSRFASQSQITGTLSKSLMGLSLPVKYLLNRSNEDLFMYLQRHIEEVHNFVESLHKMNIVQAFIFCLGEQF